AAARPCRSPRDVPRGCPERGHWPTGGAELASRTPRSKPYRWARRTVGAAPPVSEVASPSESLVRVWPRPLISRESTLSPWVALETRWALEQRHPIIVCQLDHTDPAALDERLAAAVISEAAAGCVIDFRDAAPAQARLRSLLTEPRFAPARP